jgi:sugar lactone lactonase YvrE
MECELVLDAKAELGEGPLWDDRRQRLVFVGINRGHIHEFDPVTRSTASSRSAGLWAA